MYAWDTNCTPMFWLHPGSWFSGELTIKPETHPPALMMSLLTILIMQGWCHFVTLVLAITDFTVGGCTCLTDRNFPIVCRHENSGKNGCRARVTV
eukprot:jgi/Botrbrau1/14495/Bobra.0350s0002.1